MPEPSDIFQVHARLRREHHARLEHRLVAAVEKGRLVRLEPDRVTDVVAQLIANAELLREPHDRQLHLGRRHTRRHRLDGVRLKVEHRVEGALLGGSRLADEHRPLQLAVVSVDVGARAGDQNVALLNTVAAHEAVGHRRRSTGHEHRRKLIA